MTSSTVQSATAVSVDIPSLRMSVSERRRRHSHNTTRLPHITLFLPTSLKYPSQDVLDTPHTRAVPSCAVGVGRGRMVPAAAHYDMTLFSSSMLVVVPPPPPLLSSSLTHYLIFGLKPLPTESIVFFQMFNLHLNHSIHYIRVEGLNQS